MWIALLEKFDFVAAVGPIDDALGANGVALASEAVVADCLVRVGVTHLARKGLSDGSELRLGV